MQPDCAEAVPLGAGDVPEMLELVAQTEAVGGLFSVKKRPIEPKTRKPPEYFRQSRLTMQIVDEYINNLHRWQA